ncbi:MAG: T9SS type A sorting domain-containing protein, partial [Ekhidna sp.]
EQTLTIVDALGLEDDTNFRIYPNPVTDELTIEFLNQALSGTIELMDATGKVILSRNINATRLSIPMAELQSGIYYLLHAETGRTFKVLKASR